MSSIAKIIIKVIIFTLSAIASAQSIEGSWSGALEVQGNKIPLTFHITHQDGTYTTTLDSPSQGVQGLATSTTTVTGNKIHIEAKNLGIVYDGTVDNTVIKGSYRQSGFELPLTLHKETQKKKGVQRPQEPQKPYPYLEVAVKFSNPKANNIQLAGTLTLPKGKKNPPVAILITGSGPQDRNEELLGHKPFLVLADHLTRKGIAVLRYDDRGIAESEGDFESATEEDFATDVEAAIAFLETRKDIDPQAIGLIGHSEGAMVGPIVAARNPKIAFMIMLAGLGITGEQLIIEQSSKGLEMLGVSDEVIAVSERYQKRINAVIRAHQDEEANKELQRIFEELRNTGYEIFKAELTDAVIQQKIAFFTSDWMRSFMHYDPRSYLPKLKCPILAMNGDKDVQVLYESNLSGLEMILKKAKHKDYTIQKLEGMNHLFQTATTGNPSEYYQIEETFSPKALHLVSDWITERF